MNPVSVLSARARHPGRSGFTLIEIMVVIVIIGLLAALVLPRIAGQAEKSRRVVAKTQIRAFQDALDQFEAEQGFYPSAEEGLEELASRPARVSEDRWPAGGYLRQPRVPLDPWGHEYAYFYPGSEGDYEVVCYGADGQPGGSGVDADISSYDLQAP